MYVRLRVVASVSTEGNTSNDIYDPSILTKNVSILVWKSQYLRLDLNQCISVAFKCTHPSCGKFFNRHDNLLQHLKVHKENSREESDNLYPTLKLSPSSPSPSPELEPAMDHETESSESEAEILPPSLKLTFPLKPISYDSWVLPARFEASCNSYITNMAVSSLRTELSPHSPPTSRVRDSLWAFTCLFSWYLFQVTLDLRCQPRDYILWQYLCCSVVYRWNVGASRLFPFQSSFFIDMCI